MDENLQKKFIDKGYKITWITEIDYAVITEFPHRNMLSILFAIKKVYPLLDKFIKVRTCPSLRIGIFERVSVKFFLLDRFEEEPPLRSSLHRILQQ